jgi:hypothetical protein
MWYLLIAHTLGIVVATCFAVVEFPSIVLTGPLLIASGVLIALTSYRRDRLVGFLFGLATPSLGVLCVLAISLMYSRLSRAHEPVCTLLVLFSIVSIAMCGAALGELRSARQGDGRRSPFQFSIGSLLLLMLALSVALGLGQALQTKAAAVIFSVVYGIAYVYVCDRFFARRFRKACETRSLANRLMSWLLLAQTVGILVAVVFAVMEIESIVASAPILSLSGALIGLFSFRRDRLVGLLFGLSAPTMAAFCLFLIATLEWDPRQAQIPVGAILVVYGLLGMPAGTFSVHELHTSGNTGHKTRFQFSIAALLTLMFVLALSLGLSQTGEKGIVVGAALGYLVVLLYVLNQFFRNRRLQKLACVSSFLERHE